MSRKHKPMLQIGGLSAKSRDLPHFTFTGAEFQRPDRVCNALSTQPLQLASLWTSPVRPGADHSHLRSVGTGC